MKLKAIRAPFSIRHWLAIFVTAAALFLSLDLGSKQPEYRLFVTPTPGQTGNVHVVFYGDSFKSRDLTIPASGWSIIRGKDSTVVATQGAAEPLEIRSYNIPLTVGLLHYPEGGKATISSNTGYLQKVDLKSDAETVSSLIIGGPSSQISSGGEASVYSAKFQTAAALAIFALVIAIAWRMNSQRAAEPSRPKRFEAILFALPLLLTTALTLIAYTPGNVSYDGSLQWVQAANRGELQAGLSYPATYLMRLFTLLSASPLPMLVLQIVIAALGVGMVLQELRHRGISLAVAMGASIILAAMPQYFTFFTGLGKDPLSLIGALFFTWALLALFRQPKATPGMLTALALSAVFSGLMRANALPAIMPVFLAALGLLFWKQKSRWIIGIGVMAIAAALLIPKVLTSEAAREIKAHHPENMVTNDLPLGTFTNWYIFHFFNAAIASGVDVPEQQAQPFFALMPKDKWQKFSCYMTDDIMIALSENIKFTQIEYIKFLQRNQPAMAMTVLRLAYQHPGFALRRQACMTQMLWRIGMNQIPFQATTTLGYDTVDKRFIALAGESRTQWPALRLKMQSYQLWTQQGNHFWLFWKPALPLILGIFIVGMYLANRRDAGTALALLLPLLSIAVLALSIPFPAYRYAYPGVLLMQLLSLLVFARPPSPRTSAT